jgi:hypothetical protein
MDSGIIVALALAAMFFGAITWLVIHARRQERQARQAGAQPAPEERGLESSARSTRQPSLRVGPIVGESISRSERAKLR